MKLGNLCNWWLCSRYFFKRKSKDIDIVTVGSGIELAKKVAEKLKNKPQVNCFQEFGQQC